MKSKLSKFEDAVGGRIEKSDESVVPGVNKVDGTSTLYFTCPKGVTHRSAFKKITTFTDPPIAKFGGAVEAGCEIETSSGDIYHGIQFHGDLDGWSEDIKAGAVAENISLAIIEGNTLVTENGLIFDLDDCTITFS